VQQVRFKVGHGYFPGVISGDHGDGTYDMDYDDGEKETGSSLSKNQRMGGRAARYCREKWKTVEDMRYR
jgi:hypothetical protein